MTTLGRLRTFSYWYEVGLLGLFVALMVVISQVEPAFASRQVQAELSTHVFELAILALPMTFIMITGGIDLSAGSTMALSAVVLGLTFERGAPPSVAALLAVLAGAMAGALNGVFVAHVHVHPLIVTLATLSAYRGIAEGVSLGRPISGFPEQFTSLGTGTVAGVPLPGIIFALAALGSGVMLMWSAFGRRLYAIGFNENACRFSGISVDRIKLMLYTLSGTAAGLAAVIFAARRNTAKADVGLDMELNVITAVVLGGTSVFGGRGTLVGTLLGVALIHETSEFVSWRWHSDESILLAIGVLLVVSVLLNGLLLKRRQ
ncbi:MAG TPA: ABC transporter permease [Phycisphaerae bacterium]|nr:ABC transporter permease [Phycisphaerae bacterium]